MYGASHFIWRKSMGNFCRSEYEAHTKFVKRMEEVLSDFKELSTYSLEATLPKEEELPKVSVITITKTDVCSFLLRSTVFLPSRIPKIN
jgi:hypothetical protein